MHELTESRVTEKKSSNLIYDILKNRILSFELCPGDMLSENTLSAQFSTGRAQVRDALARLTEEGYIVVYPQKGTEVTKIDQSRLQQAVHAHIVLEQAVIRELCDRQLEEEQYVQLKETMEDKHVDKDGDEAFEFLMSEQQMHDLLALYGGRPYIRDVFRTLDCDLLRVSYLLYRTFSSSVSSLSLASRERAQVEGRLLVSNLRRGDKEAACLLCANHFNAVLGSASSIRGIYPQYFV